MRLGGCFAVNQGINFILFQDTFLYLHYYEKKKNMYSDVAIKRGHICCISAETTGKEFCIM